jgi:hypothetical protein
MGILKCEVSVDEDGMMSFSSDGKVVALRLPSGRVVDLRPDPPFVAIVPCPYCIAIHSADSKGKDHVPECHIDPSLGEVIIR